MSDMEWLKIFSFVIIFQLLYICVYLKKFYECMRVLGVSKSFDLIREKAQLQDSGMMSDPSDADQRRIDDINLILNTDTND